MFCEEAKVLERPTLGHQPIVLGGLFAEVHDEFLPGLALWSTANVALHTSTIKHNRQETKWTKDLTLDEKLDLLKIFAGGSLSLDMKAGKKISASGSFQYLDDEKVKV